MDEKILLKIALAATIVGLAVLYVLSSRIKIDTAMLNRLDSLEGEQVYVTGIVIDVGETNQTTFLRIEKNEMTSVVLFGRAPGVGLGDFVQIRGKVADYNGEKEIIAEEVRVI
jgi:hypothetical protein